MTLYRTIHDEQNPYVIVNTTIIYDERLSAKAKGIWLYAFSRPNDWKFYQHEITSHFSDGESAIQSGIDELIKYGYLHRVPKQNPETGIFEGHEWNFFETPKTKEEIQKMFPKRRFSESRKNRESENRPLPSNNYNQIKTSTKTRDDGQNQTCQTDPEPDPNEGLELELGLVDLDLGSREVKDALRSTGLEVEDCKKLWYTLLKQFGDTTVPERLQAIRLTHESLKRNEKIQNPIAYMIAGCKKRLKEMATNQKSKEASSQPPKQNDHVTKNLSALKELQPWSGHCTEKGYLLHVGNDYVEFTLGSHLKRFEVSQQNFIDSVGSYLKTTCGSILKRI